MVSQAFVATASNILANAFGFTIRGSLAVAFTQYLWHLLRAKTMKVSTIELLFCLRTNPFTLFKPAAIAATPSLAGLAIFMWGTQVATGFPPGAISVTTTQVTSYKMVTAPTFNASFVCRTPPLVLIKSFRKKLTGYVMTDGKWIGCRCGKALGHAIFARWGSQPDHKRVFAPSLCFKETILLIIFFM